MRNFTQYTQLIFAVNSVKKTEKFANTESYKMTCNHYYNLTFKARNDQKGLQRKSQHYMQKSHSQGEPIWRREARGLVKISAFIKHINFK